MTYKPYKLMTLYSIGSKDNNMILATLISLKFNDTESLKKILPLLNITYSFITISITTDYDLGQIKAIKTCEIFIKNPYAIPRLFHYSQAIIRKFKKYNIIKKK